MKPSPSRNPADVNRVAAMTAGYPDVFATCENGTLYKGADNYLCEVRLQAWITLTSEGWGQSRIASACGCPRTTVTHALMRARREGRMPEVIKPPPTPVAPAPVATKPPPEPPRSVVMTKGLSDAIENVSEAYSLWWELEREDGIKPQRVIWACEVLYRLLNEGQRLQLLPSDGRNVIAERDDVAEERAA